MLKQLQNNFALAVNTLALNSNCYLYFDSGIIANNIQVIAKRMRYQVYVVELSKKVFTENVRFRIANPQFNGVLECLYVGMTSKTPKERFHQHKTRYVSKKGHRISAYIVEKYGTYLRPSLYDHINLKPMTREEALRMEEKLALHLRRQGYAVWFN